MPKHSPFKHCNNKSDLAPYWVFLLGLACCCISSLSMAIENNEGSKDSAMQSDLKATHEAPPNILVSIKPLQLIAAAVTDGLVEPQLLLTPGMSVHHLSLKPKQRQQIEDADLFFWIGDGLENGLDKVVQIRKKTSMALSNLPKVTLKKYPVVHEVFDKESGHPDEHNDADQQDKDQHHGDHDHTPGAVDYHLWLDPDNAKVMAEAMGEALMKLRPQWQDKIRKNITQFESGLTQKSQQIQLELQHFQHKPFFVLHDTYAYFERAFGLKGGQALQLQEDMPMSAKNWQAWRQAISQAGSVCLFSEPPPPERLIKALSRDLPVHYAIWDAQSVNVAVNAQGYLDGLQSMADQFIRCQKTLP